MGWLARGIDSPGAGPAEGFGRNSGLPRNNIRALTEDREGRLWVAVMSEGVFRQSGERFERYVSNVSENGSNVLSHTNWRDGGEARALLCDRDGLMWLATRGRRAVPPAERADGRVALRPEDGVPSNHQSALLEDRQGQLWVSSENGIFGSSRELLDSYRRGQSPRLAPWRLTQADGLAYKVCSGMGQPAGAKSADGRLWFAERAGAGQLRPGRP